MLLRRVISHVKTENWFAVCVDFVIVVLGVFLGIQFANSNEVRQDRAQETLVLERLRADFRDINSQLDDAIRIHSENIDGLQVVIAALESGNLASRDEVQFQDGLLRVTTFHPGPGRAAVYTEILSSGQVRLIKDEDLRTALGRYDEDVSESGNLFLHIRNVQTVSLPAFQKYFVLADNIKDPDTGRYKVARIAEYDFDAMIADPDFIFAARALRQSQLYYYQNHWHLMEQVREIQQQLGNRQIDPSQNIELGQHKPD